MKPVWIVTADSTIANIYSYQNGVVEEEKTLEHEKGRALAQEIDADRQGVTRDPHSGLATYQREMDPVEKERRIFAARIVEEVEKKYETDNAIEGVVYVAEPSFLGHIRECRTSSINHPVIAEIPKDLVHADREKVWEEVKESVLDFVRKKKFFE